MDLFSAIRSRRAAVLAAAVGIAAVAAGCGSSSSSSTSASSSAPTVLAAASLTKAFPRIDPSAKYTFGGSGALETQIEQGAPADVFAAANKKDPAELFAKGLVEKPVELATNTLVMIVPQSNPAHIASVNDITKSGVKIVVCNSTVPCGDYAAKAFANLGITAAASKNIVSQQTDVKQVVAQIALGQADVGFVYITDAKAASGKVSVVYLPAAAKPGTTDYIAVVKAAKNQAGAKAFVQSVLSAKGQAVLHADGFGAP